MIPKECKRLAEVDFPIAVVSAHSAREKSIRHGHPSTLHLWWARRPLAACRAMLLTLLLPDPCDENCPAEFKEAARTLLHAFPGVVLDSGDLSLRRAILHFVGDFANWDNAAKPRYLEVGRGLVKAAHPEEAPLVVDPFAGGGSIPLEALRLGCESFASDLNPVACLILKVMLEDIPRHGLKLVAQLRQVGAEIKRKAEEELAQYYPPDQTGRPQSPIYGHALLSARLQAAARKFLWFVLFGCRKGPSAELLYVHIWCDEAEKTLMPSLRSLSLTRIQRCQQEPSGWPMQSA
jgi:adenine-specific DNA methylase